MQTQDEVERKYDLPDGGALDTAELTRLLARVPGVASVSTPETTELDATYVDTDRLDLLRHRVTFRRREGGGDAGWHVKLRAGGDRRIELHAPLGRSRTAPARLAREVAALTRGRALRPVARLTTQRTERHLCAQDGTDLAVVTDDLVRARRTVGGEAPYDTEWREFEVELVDGPESLLDDVETVLLDAGLRRAAWPSKLARGLGDAVPQPPARRAPDRRRATVGDVLLAHLDGQVEELQARHRDARTDEPDGVHKMRVATRRLRSALATYRPALERDRTDPLRDELKWLGEQLGHARDAEVQHERLRALVGEQPREVVLGPVRRRVDLELHRRHKQEHARTREALDSERCYALLDALDDLVVDPPLAGIAGERAADELPRLVRRAVRRVEKARKAAAAAETPTAVDVGLHDVRKAAKRARYAAESAAPALGTPATRLAERMEEVQELLGERQDTVTGRMLLRELAVAAHGAGESAFTYGLLYALEQARADRLHEQAGAVLDRGLQKKLVTALD